MSDPRSNVIAHLEELRKRLIVCAAALCATRPAAGAPACGGGSLACWFFSDRLLEWIAAPAVERVGQLYFLSPSDAFMARLRIAIFGGLIVASPVIFSQLWAFIAPGLEEKERKLVAPAAAVSSVL